MASISEKISAISAWNETPPKDTTAWAKDTEQESLHIQPKANLTQMQTDLEERLPVLQKELYLATTYPDAYRVELIKQGIEDAKVLDKEVQDNINNLTFMVAKVEIS